MADCGSCRFFVRITPRLTRRQEWEADPRPMAKWFWQHFSLKYKTHLDDWADDFDKDQLIEEKHAGWCHRFPKSERHYDSYWCKEYSFADR